MNTLAKLILKGLAAILPMGITLYFIVWFFSTLEALIKPLLLWFLSESLYFPGLGILAGIVGLLILGLLVNAFLIRHLVSLGDQLMDRIPLVKSLYGALKDMMTMFSQGGNKDMKTVVSIELAENLRVIGFVTGEQAGRRLFDNDNQTSPLVGVYLPMSYQMGGYTVYVPRDRLTKLDIGIEEAMRLTITGGVQDRRH